MSDIVIGSFNLYKYRAFESSEESRKDVGRIAEIIRDAQFDIVALQEVFNEGAVSNIVHALGPKWEYRWDSPPSRTKIAAEGYAFIWNKDRFDLPVYDGGRKEPRIFNQYHLDRALGQKPLIRNPYYGRFVPTFLDMPFELRLINAHILFSSSSSDYDENLKSEPSALAMRRNEFKVLASALYPKVSDRIYGNNYVAYTILLGDYNLNLRRSAAEGSYLSSRIEPETIMVYDGRNVKEIVTVQEDLTTFKQPPKDQKQTDYTSATCWANNYDHFTYDGIRFDGVSMTAYRVNSLCYCTDYKEHRRTISDHAPVKLVIDLRNGR